MFRNIQSKTRLSVGSAHKTVYMAMRGSPCSMVVGDLDTPEVPRGAEHPVHVAPPAPVLEIDRRSSGHLCMNRGMHAGIWKLSLEAKSERRQNAKSIVYVVTGKKVSD